MNRTHAMQFAAALACLLILGCTAKPSPESVAVAPASSETVAAITLANPLDDTLIFRFVSPDDGAATTASALSDIPEAARAIVVVMDMAAPTAAGWDHVVDLSAGLPATTVPTQNFHLAVQPKIPAPAVAKTPSAKSRSVSATRPGAAKKVTLFSTRGCGYCKKARAWLKKNKIPYSERDLERDPGASPALGALGKKAGLGPRDLQGVPIIFVDGAPVLGFDVKRLETLLLR